MFLLIDNYDSFTYNLVQAFQRLGRDPVVVKNDDPALLDLAISPKLEMVCISPGPGHPANAGLCSQFLDKVDKNIPILGICLGHQLLGLHAGANIEIAPVIMHGKQSGISHNGTGMFQGLPRDFKVGRYHSLVVQDSELTEGSFTVTARGDKGEVMALQYKDRPWVGAQFHPESVLTPDGLDYLANFPDAIVRKKYKPAEILNRIAMGQDLPVEMAAQGFAALMDGQFTPAQGGAFLMGLHMKGETPDEIGEAIAAALARAQPVESPRGKCIDIVGTGGDGKNSFNCSTAAALTLAGMGYKVVKHGNRAASSTCGAADALDGLGIALDNDPKAVPAMLAKRNFAFMFAPYFHPAFKNVGPIRKELGVPTLFNILGPMINPARPSHLLMGTPNPEIADLASKTMLRSQLKRVGVICGAGGYDELTAFGPNQMLLVENGEIQKILIMPSRYGFSIPRPQDLAVRSREEAIAILKELLSGQGPKPMQEMLMLNAGAAIFLMNENMSFDDAMASAMQGVKSGAGIKVVENA